MFCFLRGYDSIHNVEIISVPLQSHSHVIEGYVIRYTGEGFVALSASNGALTWSPISFSTSRGKWKSKEETGKRYEDSLQDDSQPCSIYTSAIALRIKKQSLRAQATKDSPWPKRKQLKAFPDTARTR